MQPIQATGITGGRHCLTTFTDGCCMWTQEQYLAVQLSTCAAGPPCAAISTAATPEQAQCRQLANHRQAVQAPQGARQVTSASTPDSSTPAHSLRMMLCY
jgi:hypothetical protein